MNLSPSTSPYSHDAPFDHLRAMMIEQQRNESIRAIVVHLLSTAVPALHTNSFVVETKEVDFGPTPSALIHMASPEGLWVTLGASRNGAFFFLSNRYGSEDDHFGMPCSFEVSGPWHEATDANFRRWCKLAGDWQFYGHRFFSPSDQSDALRFAYDEAESGYRRIKTALTWQEVAGRYPLASGHAGAGSH